MPCSTSCGPSAPSAPPTSSSPPEPSSTVTSPGSAKKSAHASGRAFDVDGIVWHPTATHPGHSFYAIDHASKPRLYWSCCAVFNRHMRHVLHAAYNRPHHDHIHVEDTRPTTFGAGSRASVTFLQSALAHVHNSPVAIDGVFGLQTREATREVIGRLGITGSITDVGAWHEFNLQTGHGPDGIVGPRTAAAVASTMADVG